MIYQTERLILRSTEVVDADFILRLLNTPKWLQYIGDRNVNTVAEAEEYIRLKMLPQLERLGYSNFTLIRKEDNAKIGCCGLYDREGIEGVDLGFALLPEYEGQGYASESALRILGLARTVWKINKVSAITSQKNESSQSLLLKLGFELKDHIILNKESLKLFEKHLVEKTGV